MSTHTKSLHAAGKFGGEGSATRLMTGAELAAELGVSHRLIEKWSSTGVIPKLALSSRMTRYQLPKVIAALEQYETATLRK